MRNHDEIIDENEISEKSLLVCTLLAFFLGGLGAHRLYVGKWKSALIYIAFSFLPCFSPVIVLLFGIEDFWVGLKAIIILGLLPLCVAAALIYDIYAMYSESFMDSHGKLLIKASSRRQPEHYDGDYVKEEFIRQLNIEMIIWAVILVLCLAVVGGTILSMEWEAAVRSAFR